MSYINKKIALTISLLLLNSLGYLYGDYKAYTYEDNRSDFYDDASAASFKSEDCFTCQPVSCGCRGFITAEALYWRAYESGLDTCVPRNVTDTITSDNRVVSIFSGRGRDPHFKWYPGFRVGMGFGLAGSALDISANWTHFHSHADGSNDNHLRWNINLDVIDIIASYRYELSCISLTPFGGIRGAKIDQKIRIGDSSNFSSVSSSSFSSSSFSSLSSLSSSSELIVINNKQDFSGIGPLLGLEADWDLGCGFSFYANTSISWLYGKFNVRLSESTATEDTLDICRVRKRLDATLAGADAGFGIRMKKCFCRNTQIILQLGLEHHRYFDYNRLSDCGDLSFDGVNLAVGFEY